MRLVRVRKVSVILNFYQYRVYMKTIFLLGYNPCDNLQKMTFSKNLFTGHGWINKLIWYAIYRLLLSHWKLLSDSSTMSSRNVLPNAVVSASGLQ